MNKAFLYTATSCGWFAAICFAFYPFVADDAYIVGRYAFNMLNGHGLVYNIGESISALTSPLHALLVTFTGIVFEEPVSAFRAISIVFPPLGWLLAIVIYRPSAPEIVLVSLFALGSPFLALWSVGGLETPILAMLLTLFAAVLFRVSRRNDLTNKDMFALGTLAGFAFLTRYDSLIITLPPMLAIACIAWHRVALWCAAFLSLLIAGSWLIYSFVIYGDVLPTSAYLKLSPGASKPVDGIGTLVNFVILSGVLILLPSLFARNRAHSRSFLQTAIMRGGFVSAVIFFVYASRNSGVHMMFSYRMFVPLLFVLGMILAAHISQFRNLQVVALGALQISIAIYVATAGMNPMPIRNFGALGSPFHEYGKTTPQEYGAFIGTLRQDAIDLKQHWSNLGVSTETPKLYVHTAGMGYWIPEFYLYDALVSYRHDCKPDLRAVYGSTTYVQDLSILSSNERLHQVYLTSFSSEPSFEELSRSTFQMDTAWTVHYKFARPRSEVVLPKTISEACGPDGEDVVTWY